MAPLSPPRALTSGLASRIERLTICQTKGATRSTAAFANDSRVAGPAVDPCRVGLVTETQLLVEDLHYHEIRNADHRQPFLLRSSKPKVKNGWQSEGLVGESYAVKMGPTHSAFG